MQGAVSHHLHITAPAVEGTDYAPRTYFLVGGVRVFLSGYGFNNLTGLAFHVNNHVVAAGFGNHDVCATGSEGEFFTKGVGADAVGVTQVHIPGGILAEFHFCAGFQRDALHYVQGAVGPHLHVRLGAPSVEGTYQAPGALFGIAAVRIASRNIHFIAGDHDGAQGFNKAVPAIVPGRFLDGSAESQFYVDLGPFHEAHAHDSLGQVGYGDYNLTVLDRGIDGAGSGCTTQALENHRIVHRHLLVEVLTEVGRLVVDEQGIVGELVREQLRRSGFGSVKNGLRLLHAGHHGG